METVNNSTNFTIFVTKVVRYEIHISREERGFVSVINDKFLIATDERLPLGVDIHLKLDKGTATIQDKYRLNVTEKRTFERTSTGNVSRASYSLPNCSKHIPILISPNYKPLCKQAKLSLKPQYPGVVFNSRPSC